MPGSHQMKLSQVINDQRSPDTVIAWRGKQALQLRDFRSLVLALINEINHLSPLKWALCFNDSYYFSAALLATLYCGKTPVIPGHLREAVLKEQADEYDALLTDLPLLLDCPTVDITSIEPFDSEGTCTLPLWPKQRDLILFTSGSTGKPKAIAKSIELLELENQFLIERFCEQLKDSHIVSIVSHQHLYGLTFRILLPLLAGRPFDADLTEYHEQLQIYSPKKIALIASPAFLKRLDIQLKPIACRLVFSAGGPLDYESAQHVKTCLGVLPQEIYGTSETGIIATRAQATLNQIWSAFSGIIISQNPDQTIKINSPLFKEDEGGTISDIIQLESGGFHLAGRKDRIIKIEEKRISLTEIEQRLLQLPEIEDASVVTLTQDNRTIIGAVVVLSAYGCQQKQQLSEFKMTRQFRQTLRNWLEPVALPKRWRIVNAIPVNNQGKRTYLELQELFL